MQDNIISYPLANINSIELHNYLTLLSKILNSDHSCMKTWQITFTAMFGCDVQL